MIDPHAYGIELQRRVIDGETVFEARVRELPDLTEYADTAEEAYALALDAIETTTTAFAEMGREMPVPMEPMDEYSGRVTLRVPRSLHRALAMAADEEGCSLNQHIVNLLSYFTGYAHAEKAAEAHWRPVGSDDVVASRQPDLKLVKSFTYPVDVGRYAKVA
ncbi:MAG: toxin-antitoxin system HicB family antitoxin [Rhodanobacter sp.]|nr:MAG: toxin-antitoxin system HicB family antitoxin [Rhodanobacter sp.]TAM09923.1 MAG: toxin-antitoxin system HicB family antitoxin [Rhodanobacter sp.]TAM34259.1 MAG: toxin-antitoxin system HicB family antitoxin [Rhodanobacter sp.]